MRRKFTHSILLWLFSYSLLFGAFERKGAGVAFLAGGGSGITYPEITFALFNNPALIGADSARCVNAFFRNFYQIPGLNQYNLHTEFHLWKFPLAVGLQRYGNNLYAETEIRTGMSYSFSEKLLIGISLNLYALHIERYLDCQTFSFDLGLSYNLSDEISVGAVAANLTEPKISPAQERLPGNFALGLSYTPLNTMSILMDIVKEDKFDFDYRFGIHYRVNEWLTIRSGLRETTNLLTAGLSLEIKKFKCGYALEYHPKLNLCHGFEIQYLF
ncbi:MAG: hypothetical protein JXB44_04230 [Calditrichaceae bacterium]|nr:hypothetical protein [Calditrichaceae bacterium]RQV96398.1 MAG: hypothetical protein EH224_04715 [Calditrichota bacterium]